MASWIDKAKTYAKEKYRQADTKLGVKSSIEVYNNKGFYIRNDLSPIVGESTVVR